MLQSSDLHDDRERVHASVLDQANLENNNPSRKLSSFFHLLFCESEQKEKIDAFSFH